MICNVASQIARRRCNVLVIDCDPQCNSTLLIGGEERLDQWYGDLAEKSAAKSTLLHVVGAFEVGEPAIRGDVEIYSKSRNKFNVDLVPGHPRLSVLEDNFSQAWQEASSGQIGGLRRTNWLHTFTRGLNYDYVFIDLGPSLGALNRCALLASHFFVAPVGADVFSLIGIRNISHWMKGWLQQYQMAVGNCEIKSPGYTSGYDLIRFPNIEKGFLGYTVQGYIAKSEGGKKRPTTAYEAIMRRIPKEIDDHLSEFMVPGVTLERANIGEIPHMHSIVPMAQRANAPIGLLGREDGIVGAHYDQQDRYAANLSRVAKALLENLGG